MRKENKIRRAAFALLSVVMVLMLLAACSAGSGGSPSGDQAGSVSEPAQVYDYGDVTPISGDSMPMVMPDTTNPPAYGRAASKDAEAGSPDAAAGAPMVTAETPVTTVGTGSADPNRKITFSASFTINTKNYDADYAAISDLVNKAGGYIANETSYAPPSYDGRTGARTSAFSLRIPIGTYNSFLTDLEGVGEVVNKNKASEDLTSHYFDTESRIELLEMRKERLMGYLETATDAADVVEFERELSDVLYELDQYQGEKRRLDQLVDYATINVSLNEQITPETIGADGQPLGERAGDAFYMSFQNVKIFLGNAAVFLVGALPVLVLLAVIAVIIRLFVKLMIWRHRKRKAARQKKLQMQMQGGSPQVNPNIDAGL